jgi:hypothetical protein
LDDQPVSEFVLDVASKTFHKKAQRVQSLVKLFFAPFVAKHPWILITSS